MAGIGDYIEDLLAKIATNTTLKYVRVFNNQFAQMENGDVETFPMPCAFIEILSPNPYDQLGIGYTIGELVTRVHIGMVEYDAQDGTFEQNLSIFALRDAIIALLQYYQPVGASKLMKIAETQDYEHTNVYHYMIDFKCSFVDSAGRTDGDLIEKDPPTDLVVNAEFDYTFLHKP